MKITFKGGLLSTQNCILLCSNIIAKKKFFIFKAHAAFEKGESVKRLVKKTIFKIIAKKDFPFLKLIRPLKKEIRSKCW